MSDGDRFISRAVNQRLHYAAEFEGEEAFAVTVAHKRGRKWQGAVHSCCIYDKTAEVKVSQKQWLYEVWKANGWDGESKVVRVEFRYEREFLKAMHVEDPYELLCALDGMWAYSSLRWLRHVEPDGDTNRARWKTSAAWEVV